MRFKDYYNGKDGNGYVALLVDKDSKTKMKRVFKDFGVFDIIKKLHMTLMFDDRNPSIELVNSKDIYHIKPTDIQMLGDVGSPWRSIVLMFNSPEIQKRFKELLSLGYMHSFDDLKQHISIKYSPSKSDINFIMNNKEKILDQLGVLTLGEEYSEEIDKPDPETA